VNCRATFLKESESFFKPNPMRITVALLFISSLTYGQSLEKAKKLFEEKKLEEAQKLLLAVDDDQKDYAEAQYYLGRIAFNGKAYDDAEDFFEEAIDTNDKVADYHYWYGSTLGQIATDANTLRQGMLAPKIKDSFEKTIALDPKNIDAHWGLVEFYTKAPGFMGGSWDKATQTASGIMKINKAEGYRALGIINERQEKFAEAESQFVQAYKTDPLYVHQLANFYVRQKRYDKALAPFEENYKKDPNDMSSAYQIGRICAISGQKLDVGESCLTKYLSYQPKEKEPSIAAANMRLALIKEKKGNKPEAKKLYETALKMDSNLKEAKEGLERVK
jgi:tetratricopeptide (TPR) repeat protein